MGLPLTEVGKGDNRLILLHPFPVNRHFFDKLNNFLPENWKAIFPDLPGFGDHPSTQEDVVTMEDMAEVIVSDLGGSDGHTILGGVSMGGYVSLAIADLYPNYADGYILANTHDKADNDGGKARQEAVDLILTGRRDYYISNLLPKLISATSQLDKSLLDSVLELINSTSDTAICQSLLGMGQRPDRSKVLQNSDWPILLITGDEDSITGPNIMINMHARYQRSQYCLISHGGHFTFREQPRQVSLAIYKFLEKL